MQTKRKRGRPTKYVVGHDGKHIVGMSFHKKLGQYYVTHSKPRVYLGSEFDPAFVNFRAWEARQKDRRVIVAGDNLIVQKEFKDPLTGKKDDWRVKIPEDVFWALFREKMAEDAHHCAQVSGYPLDRLHQFTSPKDSLPLSQLWDWFQQRKAQLSMQTKSDNKRYWEKFTEKVGVKRIAEIAPEHLNRYADSILGRFEKDHLSANFVINQFGLIKQVFHHAVRYGKDIQHLQRVIMLLGILENPSKAKYNPQPISVAHFQAWLMAAENDKKIKAILLLMLNGLYKPQDIAHLQFTNKDGSKVLDMDAGTIVTHRQKRGRVVRCCVLWDQTRQALKDYFDTRSDNHNALFLNETGTPYASGRIVAYNLKKYRGKAKDSPKVPESIKPEHLRDGGYSACVAAKIPLQEIQILAGHATGMPDAYVQRGAYIVEAACKAIEKIYFPPPGSTQPKAGPTKPQGQKPPK